MENGASDKEHIIVSYNMSWASQLGYWGNNIKMINPLNRSLKKPESKKKYLQSIISMNGNSRNSYIGLSQT
jgi:hypothetical protein